MILKSLTINNYGPFTENVKVDFENNITVLTGKNDSGKSKILQLIEIFLKQRTISEENVNIERPRNAVKNWNEDPGINCIGEFIVRKSDSINSSRPVKQGAIVKCKYFLVPKINERCKITEINTAGSKISGGNTSIRKFPKIIFFPNDLDYIKNDVLINSPNSGEEAILKLAFGENFQTTLQGLSISRIKLEIQKANVLLEKKMKEIFGNKVPFKVFIDQDAQSKVFVYIKDNDTYSTPIQYRGTGFQKIIALLLILFNVNLQTESILVLYDEPENSLHSDSQHYLRRFLEKLSENNNIQIIYTTHSPSMINSWKVQNIRLIEKFEKGDVLCRKVSKKGHYENFLPIRVNLGITAADTLSLAPITIIVEGETEIMCLYKLLSMTVEDDKDRLEKFSSLKNQFHFLFCGGTSKFKQYCKMSISQGCRPIIFSDGDDFNNFKQQKIEEEYPEVPIIMLEEGDELENLISETLYFNTLTKECQSEISYQDYTVWLEERKGSFIDRLSFTKKVFRWLQEFAPDFKYRKPLVMEKALSEVSINDIKTDKIIELFNQICKIAEKM